MINYSFIIPHKNCPELLRRCIDSIPARDDVQIIIVDDNSEDDKKPSIDRETVEVVLLDEQQSKGAGKARNVGIERAVGKWLLFPDSDDYYLEGFLDILDNYLYENVDIVYFNSEYMDGKTKEKLPPQPFSLDFVRYDGTKIARETIRFHHNVPWTKMISIEYVHRFSFKFEEVPNGNDIYFSMAVGFCTDNIAVIHQPLYVYLRNSKSITYNQTSRNDTLCFLKHRIQLNRFYSFIGHKEWQLPEFKVVLYYIKISGLSISTCLKDILEVYTKHRNDLVVKLKEYNNEL